MNSPINDTLQRATIGQPEPIVGMGATLLFYSDRRAATITELIQIDYTRWDLIVVVTQDAARVIEGSRHDGSAKYAFNTNPDGMPYCFARRRGTGRWDNVRKIPDGRWVTHGTVGLAIGHRDEYYDPHC